MEPSPPSSSMSMAFVDVSQWQDHADAILLAYMGGQETGNAIADILSGDVNPSSKLAQTIPAIIMMFLQQMGRLIPSISRTQNHDKSPSFNTTKEIYVGYRYYNHDNNLKM
ncbi:glycoside hydrolase family 3 C-terminal domain-containing protein [Vibrio sp. PP-XX7]